MPRFNNKPQSFYPRMSPYDKPIWDEFVKQYGQIYTGFDYDVCVGEGAKATDPMSDADRTLWNAVKKKRIDAIGYTATETHLFEVKPIANAGAIGQIQMYDHLYRQEFNSGTVTKKIIVCAEIDDDIEQLAKFLEISICIIHPESAPNVHYNQEQE